METLENAALYQKAVNTDRLEALRAHYAALYPGWAQKDVLDTIARQFAGDKTVAEWVAEQRKSLKPQY